MDHFDFDRLIDRRNTDCLKYDFLDRYFPSNEMISMWIADMDFASPFPIVEAIKKRAELGIYGYTDYSDSYYNALLDWFQQHYGYSVQKDWVIHTPGILTAIDAVIQALTEEGDPILVQSPVYFPFYGCIRSKNRKVLENPLKFENGTYSMDFEDLERKLDTEDVKLIIFCSPHNPVGRVWKNDELARFWAICRNKGVPIISDEIHCDLILSDRKFVSLMKVVGKDKSNIIICTSASKTFNLAGLQLSNIIVPDPKMRNKMIKVLKSNSLEHPNCFAPIATETAYSNSECLKWLRAVLEYIKENFRMMVEYLKENIPGIRILDLEGTYLVWMDFRNLGIPNKAVKQMLENTAKIALNDGTMFGTGGEGFYRMNIACPRSVLRDALERLKSSFT